MSFWIGFAIGAVVGVVALGAFLLVEEQKNDERPF